MFVVITTTHVCRGLIHYTLVGMRNIHKIDETFRMFSNIVHADEGVMN